MRRLSDCVLKPVGLTVHTFASSEQFLQSVRANEPYCLVVDSAPSGLYGLQLCEKLIPQEAPVAFIVTTGEPNIATALHAMRLGAVEYFETPLVGQQLVDAVDRALRDASAKHENARAEAEAQARLQMLTMRECNVFDAMANGLVTKQLATRLSIGPRTVDVHRSRIMNKFDNESPLQMQMAHFIAIGMRGSQVVTQKNALLAI